jgi:hypothetical protein
MWCSEEEKKRLRLVKFIFKKMYPALQTAIEIPRIALAP